jgi:hypothetical protein
MTIYYLYLLYAFFCTIGHIALEFYNVVQGMMLSDYSDAYLI